MNGNNHYFNEHYAFANPQEGSRELYKCAFKRCHAQFERYDANTEGLGLRGKDSEQLGR